MRLDSRTAQLCIAGTQAEFARDLATARALFAEAWAAARDDYDAAMAAHYVAHLATDPREALRWNLIALERAALDARTESFLGSLLVCGGGSYEALGHAAEAEHYFALASKHGVEHFRG
jgi:hypothetical protein